MNLLHIVCSTDIFLGSRKSFPSIVIVNNVASSLSFGSISFPHFLNLLMFLYIGTLQYGGTHTMQRA